MSPSPKDKERNTPMTTEDALQRLKQALENEDSEEVAKWDSIIRAENDWRSKCREKDREMKNNLLRIALKKMYAQ